MSGLFTGSVLARTVAVIVAVISIILSFLWLPYYPSWPLLIIAFDFVVIGALTFHGRDIVSDQLIRECRIIPVSRAVRSTKSTSYLAQGQACCSSDR